MNTKPSYRLRFKHSTVSRRVNSTTVELPRVECFVEAPIPTHDGINWITLSSGEAIKHSADNDDKVYARTVAAWRALSEPGIKKDLRRDLLKTIRVSHKALSMVSHGSSN